MGNRPTIPTQVHKQQLGTCFAYAAADVLLACWQRNSISHQETHTSLMEKILNKFGFQGAVTSKVINYLCQQYNLDWTLVREPKIYLREIIPLVAAINLSTNEWKKYYQKLSGFPYYFPKESRVLTEQQQKNGVGGHAFCLINHRTVIILDDKLGKRSEVELYRFKNSWGTKFGQNGYSQMDKEMNLKHFIIYFVEMKAFWKRKVKSLQSNSQLSISKHKVSFLIIDKLEM